jgi:MFS family permease
MEEEMPATSAQPVDLVGLIDRTKIGSFHYQLLALCAGIVFMDGFDAQAIGYVAPNLSQSWSLPPGALGPVFGTGLFGIMLGALIGGPLADYIGRKKVILFAALFSRFVASPLRSSLIFGNLWSSVSSLVWGSAPPCQTQLH